MRDFAFPSDFDRSQCEDLDRCCEFIDELLASQERVVSALTPSILDWVVCGMATSGRLKEDWAMEQLLELRAALRHAKGEE